MPMIYDASLVGKRESVVDEILLLNPHQIPLLNLLGFGQPVTQTTHEWFEDEMVAVDSTVTAAATNTDTQLTVASVEPFRANQVVKVNDELMLVTAVDAVNSKVTVVRGYAGTTAAAVNANDKIEVMFVEGHEGANAREARYKPRVKRSNVTQIFDDTIEISGTAQSVTQYGVQDLYNYERQKKQIELALQLEKAAINGVQYENGDVRQMAGIRSFIQTNVVDAAGNGVSANHLNDALQAIYEKGGFASGGQYVIMVPARQKRAISALDSNKIMITQSENARGQRVDMFVSDFGQFEIVLNNNLEPNEVFIVDTNRIAIRPLNGREFFHKFLGDQGDYTTGILVGEYTLEFRQEKAHARIKNLA